MQKRYEIKGLTEQQMLFVELGLQGLKARWQSEGKTPVGGMRLLDEVLKKVQFVTSEDNHETAHNR